MLVYQNDGNLVLYGPSGALWASNTVGQPPGFATMQDDGNVVVYRADGVPIWATDTSGMPGAELRVQDDGRLVLADIIPKDVSPLDDARALLDFGLHGGFLFAALAGLVRTALSDYRTLRQQYGLSFHDEADMREILAEHDFSCERAARNIGHNQKRMTFVARKVVEAD